MPTVDGPVWLTDASPVTFLRRNVGEDRITCDRVCEVRTPEDRIDEERLAKVRSAKVRLGEGRVGEVSPAEVRPAESCRAEVRPVEVRPAQVRPAEGWPNLLLLAISEFPKWSKYLILLSFQDNSSARSVQIGGWM